MKRVPLLCATKRVPLLLILPLLVWACSDSGTEPNLESLSDLTVQNAVSSPHASGPAGVVQAVTGGGQLHIPSSGVWRTFSIHAVKAGDGTVTGGFEWRAHQGKTGSKVKGSVVCFSVSQNQAWLAVLFEKAENPANIGKWARIRVVDNGEGMASAPDELGIHWSGFPGEGNDPADYCADQPEDPGVLPLEAGNLQIHG